MHHERYTYQELTSHPIPLDIPSVAGWKEIPIRPSKEPLVPIGLFSDYWEIFTRSIYFGEGVESPYKSSRLTGSLIATYVRENIAKRLQFIERSLPTGLHLIIFDAYRTLEVQSSAYQNYFQELTSLHPDWDEQRLTTETQKYVSLPSTDPYKPSPHNTGGAVDLAIVSLPHDIESEILVLNSQIIQFTEKDWQNDYRLQMQRHKLFRTNAQQLNFGTPYDWGGLEASLNFFENLAQHRNLLESEQEALYNRRILYNIMTIVGFKPYEDEWWHYNSPKTQMGAKVANLAFAEYGAVDLNDYNKWFEEVRFLHYQRNNNMVGKNIGCFVTKTGGTSNQLTVSWETAQVVGSLEKSVLPSAAIIAPPK